MKKKWILIVIISITILVIIGLSYFIGTGLNENTNVVLMDYSVSKDGTEVTLNVGVVSRGYIRGFKDNGGGVKSHYLTFYSTFGGINSSLGAKNSFRLELGPDDTEIYFNRANKGYELILIKDKVTGEWNRPTPNK